METRFATTQSVTARKLWILGVVLGAALRSIANDSAMTNGGSPQMLGSHPTVQMESEVIRLTVGKETVRADCRFVFHNFGPACTVRMGFPDEGYDGGPESPGGWFTSFRSYVGGKEVATVVKPSGPDPNVEDFRYWHLKDVRFPAHARLSVRDIYSVPVGNAATSAGGFIRMSAYTVSTGASWRGNIGRSEVVVSFVPPLSGGPLRPRALRPKEEATSSALWRDTDAATVFYLGPSRPTVQGSTLHFVRTNWHPSKRDDLFFAFGYDGPTVQVPAPPQGLPYADLYPFKRALTEADLRGKSAEQLQLIRNAIFARHGRPFKSARLRSYFKAQSWYRADPSWHEGEEIRRLSALERRNAAFVAAH